MKKDEKVIYVQILQSLWEIAQNIAFLKEVTVTQIFIDAARNTLQSQISIYSLPKNIIKKEQKSEFDKEFPFHSTTLQLDLLLIKELEITFSKNNLRDIYQTVVYTYVINHLDDLRAYYHKHGELFLSESEFCGDLQMLEGNMHNYFTYAYIKEKYQLSLEDFEETFVHLSVKLGKRVEDITLRDYKYFREKHQPSLHKLLQKFDTFSSAKDFFRYK